MNYHFTTVLLDYTDQEATYGVNLIFSEATTSDCEIVAWFKQENNVDPVPGTTNYRPIVFNVTSGLTSANNTITITWGNDCTRPLLRVESSYGEAMNGSECMYDEASNVYNDTYLGTIEYYVTTKFNTFYLQGEDSAIEYNITVHTDRMILDDTTIHFTCENSVNTQYDALLSRLTKETTFPVRIKYTPKSDIPMIQGFTVTTDNNQLTHDSSLDSNPVPDWVLLDKTSGNGNSLLNAIIAPNISTTGRSKSFIVSTSDRSFKLTYVQPGETQQITCNHLYWSDPVIGGSYYDKYQLTADTNLGKEVGIRILYQYNPWNLDILSSKVGFNEDLPTEILTDNVRNLSCTEDISQVNFDIKLSPKYIAAAPETLFANCGIELTFPNCEPLLIVVSARQQNKELPTITTTTAQPILFSPSYEVGANATEGKQSILVPIVTSDSSLLYGDFNVKVKNLFDGCRIKSITATLLNSNTEPISEFKQLYINDPDTEYGAEQILTTTGVVSYISFDVSFYDTPNPTSNIRNGMLEIKIKNDLKTQESTLGIPYSQK